MIDVTDNRLDVKAKVGVVGHANEDNEFLDAIEGLEDEFKKVKDKKDKRRMQPRRFTRVSARQQNAIGRR